MDFVTISSASAEQIMVYYSNKQIWVKLHPISKYLFSRCEEMQKSILVMCVLEMESCSTVFMKYIYISKSCQSDKQGVMSLPFQGQKNSVSYKKHALIICAKSPPVVMNLFISFSLITEEFAFQITRAVRRRRKYTSYTYRQFVPNYSKAI